MGHCLTQGLHRAARLTPSAPALACGSRRQDWRTLRERVARLASAFGALGIAHGDRVAVLSQNSDQVIEIFLACLWGGAVATPLNTRWTVEELRFGIGDSGARLLAFDEAHREQALMLGSACPDLCLVRLGDQISDADAQSTEQLIERHQPIDDRGGTGSDLAFLLYTGGTTGRSKGVMLSHDNLASASLGVAAVGCGTVGPYLHAVPLFHMAGIQMLVLHLLGGGPNVVLRAFQPEAMLRLLVEARIGSMMLVPSMLQMLVDHPLAASIDLSQVRRVYYGASPIAESVLDRAMAALPSAAFMQAYGMTETCITLVLQPEYHTVEGRRAGKLRSAGATTPTAEVMIAAPDGSELPRGEAGEILCCGPSIMRGYWNQPQLTAEALRNGWMHTGDVGVMDEDGFVSIVDRLKDMIVSGGENVYSTEVENALAQHRDITQCAVIGVPDERWGERVHAVIVRRPGSELDAEAVIEHCRRLIANYKCPRSVDFRDSLPMSAAGKLLKKDLRAPYWRGRDKGVA